MQHGFQVVSDLAWHLRYIVVYDLSPASVRAHVALVLSVANLAMILYVCGRSVFLENYNQIPKKPHPSLGSGKCTTSTFTDLRSAPFQRLTL
jgi:hypothetical protein